jgi:hypothetical protein
LPFAADIDRIIVPGEDIHVESGQETAQKDAEAQIPKASKKNAPSAQETVSVERSTLSECRPSGSAV